MSEIFSGIYPAQQVATGHEFDSYIARSIDLIEKERKASAIASKVLSNLAKGRIVTRTTRHRFKPRTNNSEIDQFTFEKVQQTVAEKDDIELRKASDYKKGTKRDLIIVHRVGDRMFEPQIIPLPNVADYIPPVAEEFPQI